MTQKDTLRIFSHIPQLATKRLVLRGLRVADSYDMYEYARRSDVTRYLTWNPHPNREYTKESLEYILTRYRAGEFFDWAVIWHEDGEPGDKMIGTCGFTRFDYSNNSAEIGYVINPEFRGRGIAGEAARRVIRFGFEDLGLNRIEARYMDGNIASRKVMEKLGMKYEGTMRGALRLGNEYRDVGVCALLYDEYNRWRG